MKKQTRKALNISGAGICDICKEPHFLETHHINGREIEKANDDFNLTSICADCHFRLHLGEIIVSGWYMTTSGRTLIWKEKDSKENITGQIAKPYQIPRKIK